MNKTLFAAVAFAALVSFAVGLSCGGSPTGSGDTSCEVEYLTDAELLAKGEFTDARDCKVYGVVKIGDLIWMAENLNYKTRDGNGCWCYVKADGQSGDYTDNNCEILGRFYDWPTAMGIDDTYLTRSWNGSDANHQGVCPDGWRLPNHRDWDNLIRATGDPQTAGTKLKAVHADSRFKWHGAATDELGFAALPAAYRDNTGWYYYLKYYAYWWTSTQYDYTNAMYWRMHYQSAGVEDGYERNKRYGYNVRCVKQ